jgi:hypothetical protein
VQVPFSSFLWCAWRHWSRSSPNGVSLRLGGETFGRETNPCHETWSNPLEPWRAYEAGAAKNPAIHKLNPKANKKSSGPIAPLPLLQAKASNGTCTRAVIFVTRMRFLPLKRPPRAMRQRARQALALDALKKIRQGGDPYLPDPKEGRKADAAPGVSLCIARLQNPGLERHRKRP